MADEQNPVNPVPAQPSPPPNAQEIIAAQQRALAEQIALAQQRDRSQFGPATEQTRPAPVLGGALSQQAQQQRQQAQQQGVNLPPGMTPQQAAQRQMQPPMPPPQGLAGIPHPSVVQHGGMAPIDFSRLPDPSVPQNGVTVAQLAQAAQFQGMPQQPYQQQQYQQQYQPQQQDLTDKSIVRWYPGRNSPIRIELDDSIVEGCPDSIDLEKEPQAKVVAALLSEILSLRMRVQELESGNSNTQNQGLEGLAQRVYRLEATLFEQTQALGQQARAVREEAMRQALLEQQEEARRRGEPPVDPTNET